MIADDKLSVLIDSRIQAAPVVLVVNDEADILEMLAALLTHQGYRVTTTTEPHRALELACSIDPCCIISDVVMPEMDGLELCRRLKQDVRTASIPLLLTSALRGGAGNSLLGLEVGADDYLEMPERIQELPVKVARLVERYRVERHYREIVETASDIIYTSDLQGRIISINEAGAKFFARPTAELIGVSLKELLDTESAEAIDLTSERTADNPLSLVSRAGGDRGEVRYLEAVNTLVRDAGGRATGVRGVMRDVTERRRSEERLRESEERYRFLFERNPQAMWVLDNEMLSFLAVNEAAVDRYGYSREDFAIMSVRDILPPGESDRLEETLDGAHADICYAGAWKHRLKDGTVIDVEVLTHDLVFAGKPAKLVLVNDVTERRRAEERLRESEERLRAQYQGFPIPTYSWRRNKDDFTLTDHNDAAQELTGERASELIGRRASEVYAERPDIIADFRRCFSERGTVKREFVYEMKSTGERKRLLVTYVFVPPDIVMAHLDDVTDRRRAEEEKARLQAFVQKSALEWRLTFDAIEFPVLIVDLAGRIRRLNRAAKELAGSSYEEIMGRTVESISDGQLWQKAAELVRSIKDSAAAKSSRERDEATGKTWDIVANLVLGFGDHDEHVILVARNVTRSVELEASLRRNETMTMMGTLVAGVAHEVRNPLFGISSTLDAFEARIGVQPEHQRYISVLRSEIDRLNELMRELLELGKPSPKQFYQGSIEDMIAQAVQACTPLAEQSGVEIANQIDRKFTPMRMDRRRLIQVFSNLFENAIHHSPPGGKITVEAEEISQDDQLWIECSVKDSGSGFQPEDIPRIFEPFFTRRRKGSGLGLSIVQRIVEEHKGTITPANRSEGGAVMTLKFRLDG